MGGGNCEWKQIDILSVLARERVVVAMKGPAIGVLLLPPAVVRVFTMTSAAAGTTTKPHTVLLLYTHHRNTGSQG